MLQQIYEEGTTIFNVSDLYYLIWIADTDKNILMFHFQGDNLLPFQIKSDLEFLALVSFELRK
jgi:hypothetical protein